MLTATSNNDSTVAEEVQKYGHAIATMWHSMMHHRALILEDDAGRIIKHIKDVQKGCDKKSPKMRALEKHEAIYDTIRAQDALQPNESPIGVVSFMAPPSKKAAEALRDQHPKLYKAIVEAIHFING